MKIDIIYRCCELETGNKPKRDCRPFWFNKESCLNNLLKIFKKTNVRIHAIHDGPTGPLFNILNDNNILINKIGFNNNEKSLRFNLNYAKSIETDILYFLEDDYLHTEDALEVLLDGFELLRFNKSIISLYDAMDRYTRIDDVDYHKTLIKLGKKRYWRTAESTTCTWSISKELYDSCVYDEAIKFGLSDRELFRYIRTKDIVLFTPLQGASTHCHEPFLSPFVNWANI